MTQISKMLEGEVITYVEPQSLKDLKDNAECMSAVASLRALDRELAHLGVRVEYSFIDEEQDSTWSDAYYGAYEKHTAAGDLQGEMDFLREFSTPEFMHLERWQTLEWNDLFGCDISHYPAEVINEFMMMPENPYEVTRLAGSDSELHVYARPRDGRRGMMTYQYTLRIEIRWDGKKTITVSLAPLEKTVTEFSAAELVRMLYEAGVKLRADEDFIRLVAKDAGLNLVA